jgi:hypothetical protein
MADIYATGLEARKAVIVEYCRTVMITQIVTIRFAAFITCTQRGTMRPGLIICAHSLMMNEMDTRFTQRAERWQQ